MDAKRWESPEETMKIYEIVITKGRKDTYQKQPLT